MAIIFTIMIIMFIILIAWSWHSLGTIETKTKIISIIIGVILIYGLTWIIFTISKTEVAYENNEGMDTIKTAFVALFSIINGYIILPFAFRKLEQINNEEIEKEKLKKSIVIILIAIVIIALFETKYFANTQKRIIETYNIQTNTEINKESID